MTPGEIGKDLRSKGFTPEFMDDEPRDYLGYYSHDPNRTYFDVEVNV